MILQYKCSTANKKIKYALKLPVVVLLLIFSGLLFRNNICQGGDHFYRPPGFAIGMFVTYAM
jgi:hypothetical protein